jgi:hypothetical protein
MAALCAELEEGGPDAKAKFAELSTVFAQAERELRALLPNRAAG